MYESEERDKMAYGISEVVKKAKVVKSIDVGGNGKKVKIERPTLNLLLILFRHLLPHLLPSK